MEGTRAGPEVEATRNDRDTRSDYTRLPSRLTRDTMLSQEITHRLENEFQPEEIILFGSHAWGTPDEDSDLDLLVIVPQSGLTSARSAPRVLTGICRV